MGAKNDKPLDYSTAQRRLRWSLFLFKGLTGRFSTALYLAPLGLLICLLLYYITTRYEHWIPSLFHHTLNACFAFVIVCTLAPLCMKAARKFNIVGHKEHPRGRNVATPLLGGVAIYLAFTVMCLVYMPLAGPVMKLIIGGGIIVVLGTIDDIAPLSSKVRLLGQLLAAGIFLSSGMTISFLPDTWWGNLLAVIISYAWIIGIINATNFIDGVDGLAAGFVVICCVFFFLITLHLEQEAVAQVTSLIIGAGLGFLVFNFHPAKIYLGDGGSTFLGYLLACVALYGGWSSWDAIVAIGIPTIILSILIFDIIYITISRIRNGQVRSFKQWLDYRGRDHFHHRLMNLGFKERDAVLYIYSLCIILGLSALVIEHARVSYPVVLLLIQTILIFINITMLMLVGRNIESD